MDYAHREVSEEIARKGASPIELTVVA